MSVIIWEQSRLSVKNSVSLWHEKLNILCSESSHAMWYEIQSTNLTMWRCIRVCVYSNIRSGVLAQLIALPSVMIVYIWKYMCRRSKCLDIEKFIVKLSDLSKWEETNISLCDSQRSDCHASPLTSLLHHSAIEGSGKEERRGKEWVTRGWKNGNIFKLKLGWERDRFFSFRILKEIIILTGIRNERWML